MSTLVLADKLDWVSLHDSVTFQPGKNYTTLQRFPVKLPASSISISRSYLLAASDGQTRGAPCITLSRPERMPNFKVHFRSPAITVTTKGGQLRIKNPNWVARLPGSLGGWGSG